MYTADLHIRAGTVSLKYRTRKFHKQVQRNAVAEEKVSNLLVIVSTSLCVSQSAQFGLDPSELDYQV